MAHVKERSKTLSQNDSSGVKTPSSTRLHFSVLKDRKPNTKLVVLARSSNFLLEKSKTAFGFKSQLQKKNSLFDKFPPKFSLDKAGSLARFLSPNHYPFILHQPLRFQL